MRSDTFPTGLKFMRLTPRAVLGALFCRALEIWNEKLPGYKYRATAVFMKFFPQCRPALAASSEPDGGFVERAKEYIDAHFSDPALSIQQLADRAYVSGAYFRRRFAQRHHLSPKQYLDFVRFQYAVSCCIRATIHRARSRPVAATATSNTSGANLRPKPEKVFLNTVNHTGYKERCCINRDVGQYTKSGAFVYCTTFIMGELPVKIPLFFPIRIKT